MSAFPSPPSSATEDTEDLLGASSRLSESPPRTLVTSPSRLPPSLDQAGRVAPDSAGSSKNSPVAGSPADAAGGGKGGKDPEGDPEGSFTGQAIGDSSTASTAAQSSAAASSIHVSNVGFFDRLAKASSHSDSYSVTFPPGPIGMTLEKDEHGRQCLVKGFREVEDEKGRKVDGERGGGGREGGEGGGGFCSLRLRVWRV